MRLRRGNDGNFYADAGRLLQVHPVNNDCFINGCCVHCPDPLAIENVEDWPYNWRADRGIMERVCIHGTGHPDPDSARFLERHGKSYENVHGCDGCCGRKVTND